MAFFRGFVGFCTTLRMFYEDINFHTSDIYSTYTGGAGRQALVRGTRTWIVWRDVIRINRS